MNEAARKKRYSCQQNPPFADYYAGFSGVFPGLSPDLNTPASGTSLSPGPLINLLRRRDSFIPKKEGSK